MKIAKRGLVQILPTDLYLPPYMEGFINQHGGIQQKQGGLFAYREGLKYIFEH